MCVFTFLFYEEAPAVLHLSCYFSPQNRELHFNFNIIALKSVLGAPWILLTVSTKRHMYMCSLWCTLMLNYCAFCTSFKTQSLIPIWIFYATVDPRDYRSMTKLDENLSQWRCTLPHARHPATLQGWWCAHCRASSRAVPQLPIHCHRNIPQLVSERATGLMTHDYLICTHSLFFCLEPHYNILPTVVTHKHLGIEAQHLFHYSRGIHFPEVLTGISMINLYTSVWAVEFLWTFKTGFF